MGGLPDAPPAIVKDASNTNSSACAWSAFRHTAYALALERAAELRAAEEDEAAPYASKYAAADLMLQLQHAAEAHVGSDQHGPEAAACLARLQLEHGLALAETDLLSEGEASLRRALEFEWPSTPGCLVLQQQALNALGALWSGRADFTRALEHLQQALALYEQGKQMNQQQQQQQQGQDAFEQQSQVEQQAGGMADAARLPADSNNGAALPCCMSESCNSLPAATSSNTDCTSVTAAEEVAGAAAAAAAAGVADPGGSAEQRYTTTLFYLAQVHGQAGDKDKSALFCAATLNRQLREGAMVRQSCDWAQEACILSLVKQHFVACSMSRPCHAANGLPGSVS